MAFEHLFAPIRIGSIKIPNRIVMAPLVLNYVEYPYRPTQRYAEVIEERARGGVGLLITTHVKAERTTDPYPIGNMFPCIDNDYTLRHFAEMTDAVHLHGAKIMPELSPGTGRNGDLLQRDRWPVRPSENPLVIDPSVRTRALGYDEIQRLVEAYGAAAVRAELAGFDGIEVHCFAGYLIDQFLNPVWNQRTDQYGGDLDNRMRFMSECIESARSRVSSGFPLIARLSCEYGIAGIRSREDTIAIARRLEQLGIAALHLAGGCYDAMEWLVPTIYDPQGCLLSYMQPVRGAVSIPVIVEGRISDPEYAEALVQEGRTDLVGFGRALLADPHWPRKAREGRVDEVQKCIFCNECLNALYRFRHVRCAVNPALGRERDYRIVPAPRPKQVSAIGGGPGGMEVARIAALRGHRVTLYEQRAELGGVLLPGSAPEFKAPIRALVSSLRAAVSRAGVRVETGREVSAEEIAAGRPDVVVVATGGAMIVPAIDGIDGANVVSAIEVLAGRATVGERVVVIGGGYVGCETALHPARAGRSFAADAVVIAVSLTADDRLYTALRGRIAEIYKIGDAREPRKIFDAMHEASAIGQQI